MLNELLPRHQPSETEGSASEWSRVYAALGGDSAHELMQADFAKHPEAVRLFADTFLAVHHQRLLAEEDPVVTFSAAEAEDWIQRSEIAIAEFLSVEPKQRRAFALELLPVQPSEKQPPPGRLSSCGEVHRVPAVTSIAPGVARAAAQDEHVARPS